MIKKLLYKLQLFDGVWSIPLAFLGFFIAGSLSLEYFGDPLISVEYIQQVILSGLILVFANFVAFLGGFFNFRGLQKFFYSKELKEKIINLSVWERVKLYLIVYFGLLSAFLVILWLVMSATA
ncbi:MAG: hypothetical protein EBU90_12525 [Proteobacteria bacterium]|jgi:hypothetical protein|nr:hypothetical protein [Pseudomonadota bacterium]NBP15163.1 hypothetical protein [bacterium]